MIQASHNKGQLGLLAAYINRDASKRMPALLAKTRQITMDDCQIGHLRIGDDTALLECDSDNQVRVTYANNNTLPNAEKLLSLQADWPGSLRVACCGKKTFLTAEVQADDIEQCRHAFAELRRAIVAAMGRRPPRRPQNPAISPTSLREKLKSARLSDDQLLELDQAGSWEIRLTACKQQVAIRLQQDRQALRLWRIALDSVAEEWKPAARLRALQLNAQLRGARLTPNGQAIEAEARLSLAASAGAILHTARAVAVASLYARESLDLLAGESEVAYRFTEMFSFG